MYPYNFIWRNKENHNLAWNEWYGWVDIERAYHYRKSELEHREKGLPSNGEWYERTELQEE